MANYETKSPESLKALKSPVAAPARKEGIIPAMANLRMARFVGDRIARQAIQYERRLECDSPDGRLICDEIARPDEMDAALAHVIEGLSNAGAVSAIGTASTSTGGLAGFASTGPSSGGAMRGSEVTATSAAGLDSTAPAIKLAFK